MDTMATRIVTMREQSAPQGKRMPKVALLPPPALSLSGQLIAVARA